MRIYLFADMHEEIVTEWKGKEEQLRFLGIERFEVLLFLTSAVKCHSYHRCGVRMMLVSNYGSISHGSVLHVQRIERDNYRNMTSIEHTIKEKEDGIDSVDTYDTRVR